MASQAETFCRNRRLFDVRRGVVYLRRTDNLAQHQWRHYGTVPAIKTHVIRDFGVTTRFSDVNASQRDVSADQSLADTKETESDVKTSKNDVRESVSDVTNMKHPPENKTLEQRTRVVEHFSEHPQISITEAEDSTLDPVSPPEAAADPDAAPSSPKLLSSEYLSNSEDPLLLLLPTTTTTTTSSSTNSSFFSVQQGGDLSLLSRSDGVMTSSLPAFRQPLSTSKHDQHSFREAGSFREGRFLENTHFDTWGSRHWITPEPDVTPRSYAPKRYPLMSRVVGGGGGGGGSRQLKTLTDFRSDNGTIRVIRPLPPLPGAKRPPPPPPLLTIQDPDEEDLDLHALEREKTYAMLKRIDRLLEPTRAYFVSDLTSSQREVSLLSSSASSSSSSSSSTTSSTTSSDLTESLPGSQSQYEMKDRHQVHVHQENFQKYLAEEKGPAGHATGVVVSREERDPHQEYYDRIQARLAQFYGLPDPQLEDSVQGKTRRHRGHSEPLRQRGGSVHERSSDDPSFHKRNRHSQDGFDNNKVGHDLQEASQSGSRPGAARTRPQPPVKKKAVSRSKESSDDPHRRCCGHGVRNMPRGGGGGKREGGKGVGKERGKGWGTLGEVVKNLEEKGVDLHLKCQEWVRAYFS